MLVYGDRVRVVEPRAALAALRARLPELAALPPGLSRHAALVGAFLDAGELAQGVTDALADQRGGVDARDPTSDALMAALVALARELAASWHTRFAHAPRVPPLLAGPAPELALPDAVRCKQAEGYAYYALYPEAYLAAAARAAPGPRRVIGLRSIGTGLAALVAAATNAPLPSTLRPRGDPLARRLAVAPALVDEWLAPPAVTLAIADEGPGLSGSSFGAVLDLLEARSAVGRVEVYPSHAGELGPAASERHRARWRHLPRHVVTADALIAPELPRWLAALLGPLDAPLEDLSAGAWRARRFARAADWPPSVLGQERAKFLARTREGAFVARFVGLGTAGERAFARARALHAAGFAPEPRGLVHGFLVERWIEPAAPLAAAGRERAIEHVGRYLAFRARVLPATPDDGASLPELIRMARRNLALALGPAASSALDAIDPALGARARPVQVDARLHAWEWLVAPDGRIVKADAVDHCAAHDLVGCQDLAWDVAGAEAELALESAELRRLLAIAPVDPGLLAALRPCYLAFQLGRHALAIDSAPPDEAARLRAAVERYATLVRGCLRGMRAR